MGKMKNLCIPEQQASEIKEEALKAIAALNNLIIAGVYHPNITQADFLLNTWFDATFEPDSDAPERNHI